MCRKDYDKNYEIKSSGHEDFKIKIPERICPGNQKVLDIMQVN